MQIYVRNRKFLKDVWTDAAWCVVLSEIGAGAGVGSFGRMRPHSGEPWRLQTPRRADRAALAILSPFAHRRAARPGFKGETVSDSNEDKVSFRDEYSDDYYTASAAAAEEEACREFPDYVSESLVKAFQSLMAILKDYRVIAMVNGENWYRLGYGQIKNLFSEEERWSKCLDALRRFSKLSFKVRDLEEFAKEATLIRKRENRPLFISSVSRGLAYVPACRSAAKFILEIGTELRSLASDIGMPGEFPSPTGLELKRFGPAEQIAFVKGRLSALPWAFSELATELRSEFLAVAKFRADSTRFFGADGETIATDKWSAPDSPASWARRFGISWDTLKQRILDKSIRAKKLSSKSYRIHVDDLPSDERSKNPRPKSE